MKKKDAPAKPIIKLRTEIWFGVIPVFSNILEILSEIGLLSIFDTGPSVSFLSLLHMSSSAWENIFI